MKNMKGKKNNKFYKAFSLVELSVVIVIISILTGAIVVSGSIVKDANLASARQMTANSPITHIEGLELWLETSLKESVEYNSSNGVTKWFDLSGNGRDLDNPSSTPPTFTEEGGILKGVPSITVDGSISITGDAVPTERFTMFAVFKAKTTSSTQIFFLNGGEYAIGRSSGGIISGIVEGSYYSLHSTGGEYDNTGVIAIFRFDGDEVDGGINDNTFKPNASASMGIVPYGTFLVGSNGSYSTEVAEIILYNRALFTSEIDDIVSYLMNKYDIED